MSTRRRFLGFAAATMISARINRQAWRADTKNSVPLRTLGHTGEKVSIVGIGGYHPARAGGGVEGSNPPLPAALHPRSKFLPHCWGYKNGGTGHTLAETP